MKFVFRVVTVTILTAIAGAAYNSVYEFVFWPRLFALGPLKRGAFVVAFTIPFILVGLIALGLPITLMLKRLGHEGFLLHAVAGVIAGWAYGLTLLYQGYAMPMQVMFAFFGAACGLLWRWTEPRRKAD
jgi:hypothetical protein